MTSFDKMIEKLKGSEEIRRINQLEKVIDSNLELKNLILRKNEVSKLILNSKRVGLQNAYLEYKKEYDSINEKILAYPFVEEYLDLLNEMNDEIKLINQYLENKINKILEEN